MNPKPFAPRGRRSQLARSTETRRLLLETAIALIGERNVQSATLFEIAKRAGVTTGAVQHHFPNKVLLVAGVVDRLMESTIEEDGNWPSPDMPLPQRAAAFIEACWEHTYATPRFLASWNLYFGCSTEPEMRLHMAAARDTVNARLHGRFARTFPELDGMPQRDVLLQVVFSCLRGLGVHRIFGTQTALEAAQREMLVQMFVTQCRSCTEGVSTSGRQGN